MVFNQIQWFMCVSSFPKGGFLNPISTNCVKRLTSNSSGLLTLRDFSLNWVLVFKAQWFELGVLRYQPLNWALVAKEKNAAKAEHLGLMVCAVFA
ncbi:hypothetical protein J7H98_004535 [Vibrio parahaemolyticus]|nr:hypothetical protein [Vibrio parahaemolyticus]